MDAIDCEMNNVNFIHLSSIPLKTERNEETTFGLHGEPAGS